MLILGNMLWRTTGVGAPPPQPPTPPPPDDRPKGTAEWLGGAYPPSRTSEDIRKARERFGIPDEAAQVIAAVAARQAAEEAAQALASDEQRRFEELSRELELQRIEFEGRYLEALAAMRQEMVRQIREQQELEDILALLVIAASAAE